MELRYRIVDVASPSEGWRRLFEEFWPAYRQWYTRNGLDDRPSLDECRKALKEHMPELVGLWEEFVELANGDELAARMLSLYRPPAYLFGCSQAVWTADGDAPFLVRNYDFSPRLCEGVIIRTNWNGTKLMGTSDCLWGLVDGLNEHGLAVSLTFGGRRDVGDGFGIPLILRYVLQQATTLDEAVEILKHTPSHMAYNVLALDAEGRHRLVYLAPGEEAQVTDEKVSTNHQQTIDWPEYAMRTNTVARQKFLLDRLVDDNESSKDFTGRFADEPLHHTGYESAFGTIYTAIYKPATREAEYRWRGFCSQQSLDSFEQGEAVMLYGGPREQTKQAADSWSGEWDWRGYVDRSPDQWQWYLPEFLRRPPGMGVR